MAGKHPRPNSSHTEGGSNHPSSNNEHGISSKSRKYGAPQILRQPNTMMRLKRIPFKIKRPRSSLLTEPAEQDTGPSQRRVYQCKLNDTIMGRYRVRSRLGHGSFGVVVCAADNITGTLVAVKLLHKDEDYNADTDKEVQLYHKLLSGCNSHTELFAAVVASGMHDGFKCIVFELCGTTLFDIVKGFCGLLPLPARHLVEISYQIIKGIEYLHSMGIVHTDLKPDNIALKCSDTVKIVWLDPATGFHDKRILVATKICILDLGSAVESASGSPDFSGRIGNIAYRAPEITLGLPWSQSVDAFAIGCIISELYLGDNLFSPYIDTDGEQLATVDRIVGPFPQEYARKVEDKLPGTFNFEGSTSVCFPKGPKSALDEDLTDPMKRLEKTKPLAGLVHERTLHDLLRQLMSPNPDDRITLEAASRHKYFDSLSRLQCQ